MATTEDNSETLEESADEIIQKAAEDILNREYEDAYDRLATERQDIKAYTGRNDYRNEKVVASKLRPEVARYLSEVITEEPFKGVRTLDEAEKELKGFARYYFSEHSEF